ncbi:MAG: hypothetical protein AAFV93_07820 [Chloroflexota bacterium]
MSNQDESSLFTTALLQLLEETFESVYGIYLDRNTSIFETLATLSAKEASQTTSSSCATIAAYVAHMTYYINILLQLIDGEQPQADWGHIWQTISTVTDQEWQTSQADLRTAYERIKAVAGETEWQDSRQMAGAMGIVAHNAYHLGEIRQMLCVIKQGG